MDYMILAPATFVKRSWFKGNFNGF